MAFARAVGWGTLAGGGPFMLITVPVGISAMADDGTGLGALITLMPLIWAGAITLAAMALVGLPLTWLFQRRGHETRRLYLLAGLATGAVIPVIWGMLLSGTMAGLLLAVPGVLAGGATGASWGRWREQLARGPDAAEVFS